MKNYKKKKSKIHGNGIFSKTEINKDEIIDEVINFYIFFPYISTELGRNINHCEKNYNTKLVYCENKNIYQLKAKCKIKKNEELLMNYWDTPFYIEKPSRDFKVC